MWLLGLLVVVHWLVWWLLIIGAVLLPVLSWRRARQARTGAAAAYGVPGLICIAIMLQQAVPPMLAQRQARADVAAVTKARPMPDLAGTTVLYLRDYATTYLSLATRYEPACADLIAHGGAAEIWVGRLPQEFRVGGKSRSAPADIWARPG